jgi:DNA invertase Pin-like site-specific DNA recombinase
MKAEIDAYRVQHRLNGEADMGREIPGEPIRVAQYVRMSTDYQQYSTANQADAIRVYATSHGMEVVRTYADEGKSGLLFDQRDGLRRLIEDVLTGKADFKAILVYDVSRWGRFQDPDESAYHEYVCKRAGIRVHYCAEQFENDGSPFAAIVKAIKRAMAGEYSRELSAKVFTGQCRLVRLGYRMGGYPGYGLRRMLVDPKGVSRGGLQRGEWKSISNDRIVLVPGPADEIEIVRWIFSVFVRYRKSESQIAAILNNRGTPNGFGRPWTRHAIKNILQNEKYIGNNIWNRTGSRLRSKAAPNSPETWARANGVFEPIIGQATFEAVQAIRRERQPVGGARRRFSDREMLDRLRRLLRRRGYLSKSLIDRSSGLQSGGAYEKRFGGLTRAYDQIGYDVTSDPSEATKRCSDKDLLRMLRKLLRKRRKLSYTIIAKSADVPCVETFRKRFGSLRQAYDLIGYAGPWGAKSR